MIELCIGILIGTLLGAGIVGVIIGSPRADAELEAYRPGLELGRRDALDERGA